MVIVAALLILSVIASRLSSRLGIPTLLVFLGVGMLAGSDGIGGIYFDDARAAHDLGSVALAFILFSGGLDTPWRSIRPVLAPGLLLATVGVAVTAGAIGAFAHFVFGYSWLEGLLLGSIVSSTDAAAIFGVLRARGIRLRRRLGPLLELESGSNDPMAVFLTAGLTMALVRPGGDLLSLAPSLLVQLVLGAVVGIACGLGAAMAVDRMRLDSGGLYMALTIGVVLLVFGGTHLVGGNEFLAVYAAGVAMGSRGFVHRGTLTEFHDGLAWLMQIAMFLALGLLVFPSRLGPVVPSGLALAALLTLVARPLAVFIALAPVRAFSIKDKLFLSWAGLRGAVPIILATIPLNAGLERAQGLFDVVFFVVLISVAVQGSTVKWAAEKFGVIVPSGAKHGSAPPSQLFEVVVDDDAAAIGRRVVDLRLPRTALLLLVTRGGREIVPQGSTTLKAGDRVLIATRKADAEELARQIGGIGAKALATRTMVGDEA